MLGVGARQRRQHPRGRPGAELALAHRREHRLGQTTDQFQAAADPTDIAPTAPGDLALGKALAVDQLAQQQGFFQGRKRLSAGLREQPQQRLGQIARPGLHTRGVTPEPAQGQDAPVAVDQDQALTALLGHRDARNELAVLLDGAGQRLDRARLQQPRLSETQFKSVQIDFLCLGGRGIHGANATRPSRPCLSRPLFARSPRGRVLP